MTSLEIYVLNVGQADTTIIRTPGGHVVVIDACRPQKVKEILDRIQPGGPIAHLIVTHPHSDHYEAVPRLLASYPVERVTLAPFWYSAATGTPLYHEIINKVCELGIPLRFLSGYERFYPDGIAELGDAADVCLELLGPPHDILQVLDDANVLTPNHLSIITRLTYGQFRMVLAADAQLENWAHYDREGMSKDRCDVLRAAHHGSRRGSQWETLEKLSPRLVIVSSDPQSTHELPDLIGSTIFLEYNTVPDCAVVLTQDTGTIKIAVDSPGNTYAAWAYNEAPGDRIRDRPETPLPRTDWPAIIRGKIP